MQIIGNIQEFHKKLKPNQNLGLTIGNFDGFHLGHQHLFKTLTELTRTRNEALAVFTFVPHPKFTIESNTTNFLINSYEERRSFFITYGIDYLIEQKFDRDFSLLSAADFLDKYILSTPGLQSLYLGYDFSFGANKQGDFKFAKEHAKKKGINVELLKKDDSGINPSSTKVRESVRRGDVINASSVLGRNFYLDGIVVKGQGRGKKIGFPTANIQFDQHLLTPQKGVYISQTKYRGMTFNSITNVGVNPTFNNNEKTHVETNIFDFDNDIYGEPIRVSFLKKIRDEIKFNTVNDLVEQIKKDVQVAQHDQKHD